MNFPHFFLVLRAVASVTFRELLRDKVLYNVLLATIVMIALSRVVGQLSFLRPERIVLNVGFALASLSTLGVGLFIAAPLMSREFERRTLMVSLARPISRHAFVIGKYMGAFGIIFLNWILSMTVFLATYRMMGGEIQSTLLIGVFLALVQAAIVSALAFWIGILSTTSLSVIITLGIYLVGVSLNELKYLLSMKDSWVFSVLLGAMEVVVPSFWIYGLGNKLTYGLPLHPVYVLGSILYAVLWVFVLLYLAGYSVHRKEISG